jgi:Predicted membrane protein (DUF2142)
MQTTPRRREIRIGLVLSAALLVLAVAICVILARSPLQIVGTNATPADGTIAQVGADAPTRTTSISACQRGQLIPAGTTAIELSLSSDVGPRLDLQAFSGARLLTSGVRPAGWGGVAVVVPVKRVAAAHAGVTVCFRLGPGQGLVKLHGRAASGSASATSGGQPIGGALRVDYLRPAGGSWWSRIGSVTHRIGLGRAWGGAWIAYFVVLLAAAIAALMSWLVLHELGGVSRPAPTAAEAGAPRPRSPRTRRWRSPGTRARLPALVRRLPTAAWVCALIACLNGIGWSILTPVFQAPDEQDHVTYVQQLAETGTLPKPTGGVYYSPEMIAALIDLRTNAIGRHPTVGTISTATEQQQLEADLAADPGRTGSGGAGVATAEPPLYYALQVIPYELGSGGTLLERVALMRLLSALLGGVTALFAFLFVREALPRERWAWTVGGLAIALAPLLGFMSGVVQPDVLIYAVSSAIFLCLARAFRRGLTARLALAIGALVAAGFLSKFNFLGLLPGVLLGLLVITARARRSSDRDALRALALAIAIALTPLVLELLLGLLGGHSRASPLASAINTNSATTGSLLDKLEYVWQLYLPRLPGTRNDFPGIFPARAIWFNGFVGLYGFIDTVFPPWVNRLALIPAVLITILLIRALVIDRAALRRRLPELVSYLAIVLGVLAVVGGASYTFFIARQGSYTEPRYLMPLVVLLGAALALAARGAGRRWGPAAGTLIVVLFLAHDIFSQLLVAGRYYG